MHPSFTGTSRKTRQVNLSGRNSNPWGGSGASHGSSSPTPNAQAALAQVQADRIRRQQERDRLNASKVLQRTWRGFSSRQRSRKSWRAKWDEFEVRRKDRYQDMEDLLRASSVDENHPGRYSTAQECFSQLRLLILFIDVKLEMDRMRLGYFGRGLHETLEEIPSLATGHTWSQKLFRVNQSTLSAIRYSLVHDPKSISHGLLLKRFLAILRLLTKLIPKEVAKEADSYYAVLALVLQADEDVLSMCPRRQVVGTILSLLKPITSETLTAYGGFAIQILTLPSTVVRLGDLEVIAKMVNHRMLLRGLARLLEVALDDRGRIANHNDKLLWLLANLIHIHRHSYGAPDATCMAQDPDFLKVASILLSLLATDIVSRIDLQDDVMGDSDNSSASPHATPLPRPLPTFIRDHINSLRQQSSVVNILSNIVRSRSKEGLKGDTQALSDGKSLAAYALALLRIFPKKADEIRMWLYTGSLSLRSATGTSVINFLWQACKSTSILRRSIEDRRNVLALLKLPGTLTNQTSKRPLSNPETDAWTQDWSVILLFFELYTFILKLMDDEEFLSASATSSLGEQQQAASAVKEGALPLEDVANMTLFLKNVAFTLYWHALDLTDAGSTEELDDIGTYFGSRGPNTNRRMTRKPEPGGLAGMLGFSLEYLKVIVTGLLRMLHERDSRRRFLPEGHWLMTNEVDMTGFIPAVVAEEEKRHEMQDEEEEEQDDFGEGMDQDEDRQPSSIFQHLAPNVSSAARNPRHARYLETLKRRQEKSKKKRQLQALAPRLEILRNLPFFIPFETRVQIFREFVHRDQIRRRDGFIDPDMWRISVAHGSQGRGPDGGVSGRDIISRHHAEIRRESVFDDAYQKFYSLGEGLKEPIQITFIDKFDTIEAGIDGGGVTKEFLMSVTNEAFDPAEEHGLTMFVENEKHFLYPNPHAFEETTHTLQNAGLREGTEDFYFHARELLKRYEFLGRVIGKCLYEGILVDINFAGFFLLKWALTGGTTAASNESAYRANINDLRDLDEELYQGLVSSLSA